MYIQVAVETPRHLTKRQRELLEEFEAEGEGHAKGSPESEGFFAKVAKFFEGGAGRGARARPGATTSSAAAAGLRPGSVTATSTTPRRPPRPGAAFP